MQAPPWAKPGIWGAVVGSVATIIVGFWQVGWTTAGSAERAATARADSAVVEALVPFCVAQAQKPSDSVKLAAFRSEKSSYYRDELLTKAGWAVMPGATAPNNALTRA